MLKSLSNFFSSFLDLILPPRSNFAIVKSLDETGILKLLRANEVDGYDWIHPLFAYNDKKVKAIIWELKYEDNTKVLETIGKLIFEEIVALTSDILTFDTEARFILLPIPITVSKKRERGYNQSEYIAKAILPNDLSHILLYAPQWFLKVKETESQSHSQSKGARIQNLAGCFKANQEVSGKYIILIDDVVTTGTTLREARQELLNTGARDVFAFTIAH